MTTSFRRRLLAGSSVALAALLVSGVAAYATTTIGTNLTVSGVAIDLTTAAGEELAIESGTTGTITIGGDASAESIAVGGGAAVKTVTVGSTNTTSVTNIQSGTGEINFTGHLVTLGAVPTATQSAGTAAISATSTDTAGQLDSDTTAHTTIGITFAAAYDAAPICVVSPGDAEAAAIAGAATGYFVSTTTTDMTITHASDSTDAIWNYYCIKAE